MQGYDPAVGLRCVLAPAAPTHRPLVTAAQAQLEQALNTQGSDEAQEESEPAVEVDPLL